MNKEIRTCESCGEEVGPYTLNKWFEMNQCCLDCQRQAIADDIDDGYYE